MTNPSMASSELKPCPFCGHTGVEITEGSTFRWRIISCTNCEASCGEIRHNTMGDDQLVEEIRTGRRCVEAWNTRANDGEAVYQRMANIAVYGDVWFDISCSTYEATKEQGITRILHTRPMSDLTDEDLCELYLAMDYANRLSHEKRKTVGDPSIQEDTANAGRDFLTKRK